jgi:hypothetical protein
VLCLNETLVTYGLCFILYCVAKGLLERVTGSVKGLLERVTGSVKTLA